MPAGILCLDASLALRLLVVEDDSARARSLWRSWIVEGVEVVAPGVFVFECASALRRMVVRHDLDEEPARNALGLLLTMPVSLRAPEGLVERAWEAELLGIECGTADRRLFNAVHRLTAPTAAAGRAGSDRMSRCGSRSRSAAPAPGARSRSGRCSRGCGW